MQPAVIAPAILAQTFSEFEAQFKKIDVGLFPYVHIDVMDGQFVPHLSFSEVDKINDLDMQMQIELHLMVNDPLAELEKWIGVDGLFRTIFHVESPDNLDAAMALAEDTELAVGLAINPDTELSTLVPYLDRIDVAQFMTVQPGTQGSPFVESVIEKIKTFTSNREGILTSVDGAIKKNNISSLRAHGVDIFTVGSTFMHAPDIIKTYNDLKAAIA